MSFLSWAKQHTGRRTRRTLRSLLETCLWLFSRAPTHALRIFGLRLFGAKIGPDVFLARGVTVIDPWRLSIGAHTMIGARAMLDARGGLTIGDNCNISAEIALWTAEHDVQAPDFAMVTDHVSIGDRVWICHRSIVLPGVAIGEGSVIAAGSVVTRHVPSFSVAAGVPAKVIGKRTQNLTYQLGRKSP